MKPLFTTLQAPARLGRRARTLKLRVASSVPATLTAGGRRFPVGPSAKTVSVPVRAGRSTLRLGLKLSSGGKTSSTTVVVQRR